MFPGISGVDGDQTPEPVVKQAVVPGSRPDSTLATHEEYATTWNAPPPDTSKLITGHVVLAVNVNHVTRLLVVPEQVPMGAPVVAETFAGVAHVLFISKALPQFVPCEKPSIEQHKKTITKGKINIRMISDLTVWPVYH